MRKKPPQSPDSDFPSTDVMPEALLQFDLERAGEGEVAADSEFPATDVVPLEMLRAAPRAPAPAPAPERPVVIRDDAAIRTFLYARVHNFTSACQTMAGNDLTAFVNDVRRSLSSAAVQLGGEIAQRRPDSILLVFSHNPEDELPTHAKRALHAAILTVREIMKLGSRVAPQLEAAGAPPLWVAMGAHLGTGEVTPRGTSSSERMVHATGEAVEIARLIEGVAADLHWGLVASAPTRLAAGVRVESGRSASMGLPFDDSFLEVTEITGLVPREGSGTPASHYEAMSEALKNNQLLSLTSATLANPGHIVIEDYRILRKLGEGGNASVYLAQPAQGGATQVLKVMRLDGPEGEAGLQRFMQEYALLAGIDHPNVARFHKQGFSMGCAYIAMEYFPLGDLRSRIRKLDPAIAIYYLRQIAAGLEAIHAANIVHRDLKPDNIMVRHDGIVAITDFGVAKQVSMLLTDTGAGEVVGTPYYLSPEQALGRRVDARSDLYSLGVLAYEMLTGNKPYHAATPTELLQLHIEAPVPRLPVHLRRFQPLLDKLMAKDAEQRHGSATELLNELEMLR